MVGPSFFSMPTGSACPVPSVLSFLSSVFLLHQAESATVLTLTPLGMGIKMTVPCTALYLPRISISPNPVQATSRTCRIWAGNGW